MGHPRHRLRRLLHRRLRSRRLVHGLGSQARLRTLRHVSHCDRNRGAGLGSGIDRKIANTSNSYRAPTFRVMQEKAAQTSSGSSVILGSTKRSALFVEAYCTTWFNTEDVLLA